MKSPYDHLHCKSVPKITLYMVVYNLTKTSFCLVFGTPSVSQILLWNNAYAWPSSSICMLSLRPISCSGRGYTDLFVKSMFSSSYSTHHCHQSKGVSEILPHMAYLCHGYDCLILIPAIILSSIICFNPSCLLMWPKYLIFGAWNNCTTRFVIYVLHSVLMHLYGHILF